MDSRSATEQEFRDCLARGQRRQAAEWLVRQHADTVLGLCVAMVRDRTLAEDLAQDAYGKAFKSLAGFRGEASARTWLLTIARNRCLDHLRQRARDPWGGVAPEVDGDPDQHPDQAPLPSDLLMRRDDVEDALAELCEGDRALVVLRFRNGLDYDELAMAFGLREGTVRMRVSRALARMRLALERKHAEPVAERAVQAAPSRARMAAVPAPHQMPDAPPAPVPEDRPQDGVSPARAGELDFSDEDLGAPEAQAEAAFDDRDADGAAADEAAGLPAELEELEAYDDEVKTDRELAVPAPAAAPAPARRGPAETLGGTALPRPSFPVEHPLTAYFAATRGAPSQGLVMRLLGGARSLL
ncbi:MAG: sigma-70 family RNA polymerase sigma factor [Pseudomonadota bacterium]